MIIGRFLLSPDIAMAAESKSDVDRHSNLDALTRVMCRPLYVGRRAKMQGVLHHQFNLGGPGYVLNRSVHSALAWQRT